jgi:hypothetical protein
MPTSAAKKRARADAREGKKPTTQAGEFVREEMHRMKRGGGRARSPQQAIAIGLSEARREGVKVGPPKRSTGSRKKSGRGRTRSTTAKTLPARSRAAGRRRSSRKTAGA